MCKRQSLRLDGWAEQAFVPKLGAADEPAVLVRRHIGMRRKAHNWAVGVIKDQVESHSRREEAGLSVPDSRVGKAVRRVNPLFTFAGCASCGTARQ